MKKLLEFIDSPLGALFLAYILPAILAALVSPEKGSKADNFIRLMLSWGFDARKFIGALSALLAKKPLPLQPPKGPSRLDDSAVPPVELRQGLHDDEDENPRGKSL